MAAHSLASIDAFAFKWAGMSVAWSTSHRVAAAVDGGRTYVSADQQSSYPHQHGAGALLVTACECMKASST